MVRYITLVFSTLLLTVWGCAGSKQVSQTEKKLPEKEILDERFDPTSLNDYDLIIKQKKPADDGVLDIDEFLAGGVQGDSTEANQQLPGYRVQLIATRSIDEARAVKREAQLAFDQLVYLTFDDPYYKVRVGDALSRFEANALQEVAINKGYLGAWVVRSIINTKPQGSLDSESVDAP